MTQTKRKTFHGVVVILVVAAIVFACYFIYQVELTRPTATPNPKATSRLRPENMVTATSTNTFFRARMLIDTACRSGTSENHGLVTTLGQDKVVMVIGRDSEQAEWLLIRWGAPQTAGLIESS